MADKPQKPFKTSLADSPRLGSSFKRVAPFKANSIAESVTNKLVQGINQAPRRLRDGERQISPATTLVSEVANRTAQNVVDAENMLQVLPDMQLAKQVAVSSILSPNDMMSTNVTYGSTATDLGDMVPLLNDVIEDYFENSYKITSFIADWLGDALFDKGATVLAVIPESSIDAAINSTKKISMENLTDVYKTNSEVVSMGILGGSSYIYEAKEETYRKPRQRGFSARLGLGMESIAATTGYKGFIPFLNLNITDNFNLFKIPKAHQKMVADRVQDAYGSGRLTLSGESQTDSYNSAESLFAPRNYEHTPVLTIKTLMELDKPTVGHPMVLHLPVESVIPVHVPSSPHEHIGYFVVVDRHGNPVRANTTQDFYADLAYNTNQFRDMSSTLLAQTRRGSEGRRPQDDMMLLDEAVQLYSEVVERDLISRLQNGLYGENVGISRPTEIYRMMFARACQRMYTQLVYIPISLLTYIAFDYNEFGVGKSLLESTKILGSIRAMLMFANTIASIKNSVSRVAVNIELDPADPAPDATVEFLMNEFAKTRQASYPIGASSPVDIINYLQNAATTVVTSGHPGYPETKVTVDQNQSNHTKIDTELDDKMRHQHLMSVCVPPESVDMSQQPDFATTAVFNNVLLAKRALVNQKKFSRHLSNFIQTYTENSGTLRAKLLKVIQDNRSKIKIEGFDKVKDEVVLTYYIKSIDIKLPEPDLTRLEQQMANFQAYSDGLDAVLPAFVSQEMFDSNTMGTLSDTIPQTVAVLKAHFQRKWLRDNNVMPELFKLVEFNDKKEASFDLLREHNLYMISLQKSLIQFMQHALEAAAASNQAIETFQTNNEVEVTDNGGGSTDDTTDESSGGGGGDDDFGDFDFGGEDTEPVEEDGGEDTGDETGSDTATNEEDNKTDETDKKEKDKEE